MLFGGTVGSSDHDFTGSDELTDTTDARDAVFLHQEFQTLRELLHDGLFPSHEFGQIHLYAVELQSMMLRFMVSKVHILGRHQQRLAGYTTNV
jgi:hypothetical protein